jgi:hypothetical protein
MGRVLPILGSVNPVARFPNAGEILTAAGRLAMEQHGLAGWR